MNSNHAGTTIAPMLTFRNVRSPALAEKWLRDEGAKLTTFYPRIMACRVAVESPHRHHRLGSQYHIRIDVTVPGGEIVIKHEPSLRTRARQMGETKLAKHLELKTAHKNLRQAIDDAFKVAGRRLQDYAHRQRGTVKGHEGLPTARVSKLFPGKGYGFITAQDGREIYFHKNAVLNRAFNKLTTGAKVRFAEEQGEKGLQASTVRMIATAPKVEPVNTSTV